MSQNCHSGSCSTGSHGSSSCGSSSSCGCSKECCASDCKCGSDCSCKKGGSCGDFSAKLIQMADDAWTCLLKEKIKARVEKINGAQLDQLADLVAASNNERWKEKLKAKESCNDFQEKIEAFFRKK